MALYNSILTIMLFVEKVSLRRVKLGQKEIGLTCGIEFVQIDTQLTDDSCCGIAKRLVFEIETATRTEQSAIPQLKLVALGVTAKVIVII